MRTTTHEKATGDHRGRAAAVSVFLLVGCALPGLTGCSDNAGASAQPSATATASGQLTGGTPAAGTPNGADASPSTATAASSQQGASPATPQDQSSSTGSGAPEGGSGRVIDLRASRPDLVALASPSGQIVCTLAAGTAGPTIRCDVKGAAWKAPADKTCVGGNRGDSATATPQSTTLTCHTDTILGTARVGQTGTEWAATASTAGSRAHGNATLPYGTTLLVTDTAGCTSLTTGMTCWSGTHRFTVSRETYSLSR